MHCKRFVLGLYIPCLLLSLSGLGVGQASPGPLIVKGILFKADKSGGEWVTLACNQACIPVIFPLEGKHPRVVLDMKGVSLVETKKRSIPTGGKHVTRIRSYWDRRTKRLRIVLDMKAPAAYIVSPISDPFHNAYVVAIEKSLQRPANGERGITILPPVPTPEAPREKKPQAPPPAREERNAATTVSAVPAADLVTPQFSAVEPPAPVAAERRPPAVEPPSPAASEPAASAGNPDAEIDKLTRILEAHPKDCLSYRFRGNAYDALGHREKAVADWIQAARLGDAITQSYLDFLQVQWRN